MLSRNFPVSHTNIRRAAKPPVDSSVGLQDCSSCAESQCHDAATASAAAVAASLAAAAAAAAARKSVNQRAMRAELGLGKQSDGDKENRPGRRKANFDGEIVAT